MKRTSERSGKAETGAPGVSLTVAKYVKSIFVLSYIFFHASPTYASFSPVFDLLFAVCPACTQQLVLGIAQHHNYGGPFSPSPLGMHNVSRSVVFQTRFPVLQ
jgi:hypothetical protein